MNAFEKKANLERDPNECPICWETPRRTLFILALTRYQLRVIADTDTARNAFKMSFRRTSVRYAGAQSLAACLWAPHSSMRIKELGDSF